MHLNDEDLVELIKLARDAVENFLIKNIRITASDNIARKYGEKAGVFVTLNSVRNKSEELRGCIGFPMPEKMLHDAVISAAIASATSDPRFKPVSKEELYSIGYRLNSLE